MKKKPRIMVLKLREIIYTLIFLALGIFLIVLLIHMFSGKAGAEASADSKYVPGVYTSALLLGSRHVDVEVAVDEDRMRVLRRCILWWNLQLLLWRSRFWRLNL